LKCSISKASLTRAETPHSPVSDCSISDVYQEQDVATNAGLINSLLEKRRYR